MRKLSLFFVALFMVVGANIATAQDEADYLTDENLRRYALMMESVDAMKAEISTVTNEMIKNQEGIDGKRYLEVAGGKGDEPSEFETKFVNNVKDMQEERKAAIGEVIQILATKMLPDGGKAYKAIKTALSSDEEVKARYETILAGMQLSEGGA